MYSLAHTSKKQKPRAMDKATFDMIAEADFMGPRMLVDEEDDLLIDEETTESILDLVKCPICLEILDSACRVRDCGHIFCQECAEKYGRLFKPTHCSLCRKTIVSRRDLRKDAKLNAIILSFVPNVKDFRQYLNIYIREKSGQELFEKVSKENIFQIAAKIQRSIGKIKKKKKEPVSRKSDAQYFTRLMNAQTV